VQEVGYSILAERGIELIAADKPDAFLDDTPTAALIRQVLAAARPVRGHPADANTLAPRSNIGWLYVVEVWNVPDTLLMASEIVQ
jgi:hypothetical protein